MMQSSATTTVLVVEDTDNVRHIVARILTEAGYLVLTASRGLEALDLGGQTGWTLDLALVDLGLGVENGAVLAEVLQRLQPGLPVMFMSGDLLVGGLDELPGPVLLKPFRPDVLTECVREYLATGTCGGCTTPSRIQRRAGNE
jgi:DNA-binding response OmpR family regulator